MFNRKILTLFSLLGILLGVMIAPVASQEDNRTTIAIAPLNGSLNTPIQVIANGFPPNSSVYVGIGVPESEYEIIHTAQSDAYGLVTTQILIPAFYRGTNVDELVIVVGHDDLAYDDAISVPFTVVADNDSRIPFVNIVPRSGVAGTRVSVSASGFPANEDVIFGISPQNGEFAYSLRETTNADGNVVIDMTIPNDARANRDWVVLAEVEDNRDYQAFSPTFRVTGAEPTPLPDGSEFTRSDIYLIALNDTSGDVVGCGDSVIPVEVVYDPTIAPLTASLEALFNVETRMYGQSGLYNALYQSDLTLESVNISNGLATININGQLLVGGACDTPRALAQIERTALQFSTVDQVEIFINGEPYL